MKKNFPKNDLVVCYNSSTQNIIYYYIWSFEIPYNSKLMCVVGNRNMKKQSNEMYFLVDL